MKYFEPLFRPPAEANSLIIQPTIGCSWNKCAFCDMYTMKKFTVRNEQEVLDEIYEYSSYDNSIRKVFIADGNAMVLSTSRLIKILDALKKAFPKVSRVSAYALPSDVIRKSHNELKELKDAGLSLLYTGIESGDDELLQLVNKSETYSSSVEGMLKAKQNGMQISVMILNGLGGKNYSFQHSVNSARLINDIIPEFLSTLVLSFPLGVDHYKKRFKGEFVELSILELLEELSVFIERLNINPEINKTIFRADHASNYFVLKGIFPKDKDKLLSEINIALKKPESTYFKPEWMRGL